MAGSLYAHEHAWFAHESATDDATCGLVAQFSQAWLFVLTCWKSPLLHSANLTLEGKARCQQNSRACQCSLSCSHSSLGNTWQRHTEQAAKRQQETQQCQSTCLAAHLPVGSQGCACPQHTQSCLLDNTGVRLTLRYVDLFQLGADMRCCNTGRNGVQIPCTCGDMMSLYQVAAGTLQQFCSNLSKHLSDGMRAGVPLICTCLSQSVCPSPAGYAESMAWPS